MLPPGHLASTYILIRAAEGLGFRLSPLETLAVLFSGLVLDFDMVPSQLLRRHHHDLFTHTPFGSLVLWLIFVFIPGIPLSADAKVLILLSLWLHLVLDQAGYWLCRLGLPGVSQESQITWQYPRRPFPKRQKGAGRLRPSFFRDYWQKARANVAAEIFLSAFALLLFLIQVKW